MNGAPPPDFAVNAELWQAMNKSQKLVLMVQLMNRRGGIRAREFIDRFDLDERTLRRYLADLRELGLPIDDEGVTEDRTIALHANFRRSGVQLTLPEVLSLHFGRRLFNFLDGTSFSADIDGAIERLEPAVPRATAELVRELDRLFVAVPEHAKDYRPHGPLLDALIQCLLRDTPARVEYARPDGAPRATTLEPYTLAVYRQGLYLFARDRGDGKLKTYAVERFASFEPLDDERFHLPEDYRPDSLTADSFGIIGGPPVEVRAVFEPELVPVVRERTWHASQTLEELPDGRLRLRMRVGLSPELQSWLLGFAGQVRIEAPAELAATLREKHRQALAHYAAGG